jgi:hypothetical protein
LIGDKLWVRLLPAGPFLNTMKNKIRWALAWILYWLGDGTSQVMEYFNWWFLYYFYNKLMCWSSQIQGETDNGPWEKSREANVD